MVRITSRLNTNFIIVIIIILLLLYHQYHYSNFQSYFTASSPRKGEGRGGRGGLNERGQ